MKHSDGGPSSYYDFPESWTTFNDFIEYKSEAQWGHFSFHLGNIGKVLCRWGDKQGTLISYDAKKIIYSGCRVLKMILGTEALREYLHRLLEDPQFQIEEEPDYDLNEYIPPNTFVGRTLNLDDNTYVLTESGEWTLIDKP